MRAEFPVASPWLTRESTKKETLKNQQALQRTKLRDDLGINQGSSLESVYLSMTERFQLDCFIGQYIKTRNLRSIPHITDILRTTLATYTGNPPVMVNELNAWIDSKLGYRASHPDFSLLEEL